MSYSYKGKILISSPDNSGDIFSRSVVLIIEHNEQGAFGLILNRQNPTVKKRIEKLLGFVPDIYDGGPVSNNLIFFILKGPKITEKFTEINDEFYLTDDISAVADAYFANKISVDDMKIFSGYSGWSPGQLEGELLKKYWTVVDIMNLDYTERNDQNLWKKIMQNLGGEFLIWANAPQDISLN